MEPSPQPRKRFQIHLSTAIVMMFVAGGLIWGNLLQRQSHVPIINPPYRFITDIDDVEFGFPFGAIRRLSYRHEYRTARGLNPRVQELSFNYFAATIDILIAMFSLVATWFLCERLIRRRTSRKGA